MRKLILIAGFVLASAAAQAGDRSLSLTGSDTQPASAPARNNAASQLSDASEPPKADAPRAAEASQADTPRYTERPAIVESKPDRYRDEEPRYKDEPRNRNESRYKDEPRDRDDKYRDEPRSKGERRYSDSRRSYDDDDDRPRRPRHWAERRVINALHRHGIYW